MSNYPTYHDQDKVKYLYHPDDTYHKLQLQRTTDNLQLVSKVIASHNLSGPDLRISKSTCSSYVSIKSFCLKKTRMKYVHLIYIQISDDNILKL